MIFDIRTNNSTTFFDIRTNNSATQWIFNMNLGITSNNNVNLIQELIYVKIKSIFKIAIFKEFIVLIQNMK